MPAVPITLSKRPESGGGVPRSPGPIARVRSFSGEVSGELSKATWPWDNKEKGVRRYRELTDSTIVVIVAMLLLGGFVALWDLVLNSILGLIVR